MDRQVLKARVNFSREFLKLNLDRPVSGPIYSDDYVERWAAVYQANPALRLLGCPFCVFLTRPAAWLMFAGNPLRHQAVAASTRRAEAAVAAAERAEGHGENGRLVEKTRHHTYDRRGHAGRDFIPLRDV